MTNKTAPLLRVEALNAWYGAAHVLFDVGLQIAPGEVVALMGRNGAGKSTTLKAIMGLIPRKQGSVYFLEHNISTSPSYDIARKGLAYVPEDRRVFSDLTVAENLETGRQASRYWPDGTLVTGWTPAALYELFPNLKALQNQPAGHMSGGEQQMLSVARSLMGNPYMVLLDEPSEGVAPLIVEQMADMILSLKQQGIGILLSEQNLHFAALVADRAYVLEKGQICYHGNMQELINNQEIRQKYLSL